MRKVRKITKIICYRIESNNLSDLFSQVSDWLKSNATGTILDIAIAEFIDDSGIPIYTGSIYTK